MANKRGFSVSSVLKSKGMSVLGCRRGSYRQVLTVQTPAFFRHGAGIGQKRVGKAGKRRGVGGDVPRDGICPVTARGPWLPGHGGWRSSALADSLDFPREALMRGPGTSPGLETTGYCRLAARWPPAALGQDTWIPYLFQGVNPLQRVFPVRVSNPNRT